jgi:hypothetical protein
MSAASDSLTRQFLEWLDERPRTREEALDVWRTSCPRLSIWEDAWIDCLIEECGAGPWISVTPIGRHFLRAPYQIEPRI